MTINIRFKFNYASRCGERQHNHYGMNYACVGQRYQMLWTVSNYIRGDECVICCVRMWSVASFPDSALENIVTASSYF